MPINKQKTAIEDECLFDDWLEETRTVARKARREMAPDDRGGGRVTFHFSRISDLYDFALRMSVLIDAAPREASSRQAAHCRPLQARPRAV